MKRLFFVVCIALISPLLSAQNALRITSKEGRLESMLKRKGPEKIDSLIISGSLNNTDLQYLSMLPSLVSLDISDAKLDDIEERSLSQLYDYYINSVPTSGYYKGSVLTLTGFRSLKDLKLGWQVRRLCFTQTFESLVIPPSCELKYESDGVGTIGRLQFDTENTHEYQRETRDIGVSRLRDDRLPWYGFGHGRLQTLEKVKIIVEILYLPSTTFLYYNREREYSWLESTIFPITIYFTQNDLWVLNAYSKNDKMLDKYISNLPLYSDGAFAGASISSFTIPTIVKRIPSYCFAYCKNLTQLNMGEVESIGAFAFKRSALTELSIPESVNEINADAFNDSNLKIIRMNGPAPLVYSWVDGQRKYVDKINTDAVFFVPPSEKGAYSVGAWATAVVMEEGAKTDYEIVLSNEGELKNHLTDDIILKARRLTIKGIMNDLDFYDLQKCKNLSQLDLSQCFTIKSEFTSYMEYLKDKSMLEIARKKMEERQKGNELEYEKGWRTTSEYLSYKTTTEIALKELKKYEDMVGEWSPSSSCYLPEDAFDNLTHLNEIILPKALTILNTPLPKARKVVLPPGLKRIEAFCFKDSPIGSIEFPSSLEFIGEGCFMGCKNLKTVDLQQTNISELTFDCFHGSGVTVLKAPKGLKKVYNGKNSNRAGNALFVGGASLGIPEIYFYTPTPPDGFSGTAGIKTIHIPHGYKVGWISKVNTERTSLVDDIYANEEERPVHQKEKILPETIEDTKHEPIPNTDSAVAQSVKNQDTVATIAQVEAKEAKDWDSHPAPLPEQNIDCQSIVIKIGASPLSIKQFPKMTSIRGGIGFYNIKNSRVGGELGVSYCSGLSSTSSLLLGVDASLIIRITKGIYPKIGGGLFSYRNKNLVGNGLYGEAGLTFLFGKRLCLELGASYYPEIYTRDLETVSTTSGATYEYQGINQVLSRGIVPNVSIGWAF